MSCRLEKFETILPTSKRPTGSNDWPAPAHVVHTLCRSKHGLVLVLVARAGVFVEDDFDRSVQMLTSPGVLTSVGCRESVFLTSEFINVVHIDILAIPLILGVDAGDALIDGSPGEPLFFSFGRKTTIRRTPTPGVVAGMSLKLLHTSLWACALAGRHSGEQYLI
jgi:hypothetical protein